MFSYYARIAEHHLGDTGSHYFEEAMVEIVVKGGRRQWDVAWGTLERNAKAR